LRYRENVSIGGKGARIKKIKSYAESEN